MIYLIYIFIFLFGASIGSFLNVVILRLYKKQNILKPGSHCPKCKHILKWYENIPLFSFIFLKAKCSKCKTKISSQYFFVELATGLLFLFSFLTISNFNTLLLLFYWIVISFLILIFVYDLKYYLIPDKISIPAIVIIFILQGVLNPSLLITHYSLLLLSAIIISSFFALQFLISKGKWVGGGDIRLGFLMGIILGWPNGIVALFLAYILGLIVCLPLLIFKRKNLKSQIPFGTFLTTATLITLFLGHRVLDWYLSLF